MTVGGRNPTWNGSDLDSDFDSAALRAGGIGESIFGWRLSILTRQRHRTAALVSAISIDADCNRPQSGHALAKSMLLVLDLPIQLIY